MEEKEYKSTYGEMTRIGCVFEKALTNHRAKCALSNHFCLADREGYACQDEESSNYCRELLQKLREKSSFALKLHEVVGVLPHNMEIRVQVGGIQGVAQQLMDEPLDEYTENSVDDIGGVIRQALTKYGSIDALPYSQIIQSVVKFKGRSRRQRK